MTQWLVDETGEIWSPNSERLRSRLGFAARPFVDREAFVVTNLGYVAIQQLPNGMIVRWRPTYVRRESVAATVLFLGDQPDQRVIISSLAAVWFNRLFPNVPAAADALLAQFASERCSDGGCFIARPRAIETLGSKSKMRHALDAAATSQLQYDPSALWNMLQQTVGDRYLLLDPDCERRRLRVMSIGSGYGNVSRRWRNSAQGTDFEDQPDTAYAQSAARAFWPVFDARTPVVEDVDASFWVPSRGRMSLRYTRLILPLDVAGKRRILSTSELAAILPNSPQLAQK
jgi:hypothetical protein